MVRNLFCLLFNLPSCKSKKCIHWEAGTGKCLEFLLENVLKGRFIASAPLDAKCWISAASSTSTDLLTRFPSNHSFLFPSAETPVVWQLRHAQEKTSRWRRGVRLPLECGNAQKQQLPEGRPDLRGNLRPPATGKILNLSLDNVQSFISKSNTDWSILNELPHLVFELSLMLVFDPQIEDSEGTVRQIGAFSEGINNLTVRLTCLH